jgi:hypothetical protein
VSYVTAFRLCAAVALSARSLSSIARLYLPSLVFSLCVWSFMLFSFRIFHTRKALPEMRIRSSWDAPFKLASLVWVVSGSCALGIAVSSPQFIIVSLVISGYLVGRFPDLYINELHPHAHIHKFERFPAVTSVRLRLKAYYKYTTTDLKQHRRSKD